MNLLKLDLGLAVRLVGVIKPLYLAVVLWNSRYALPSLLVVHDTQESATRAKSGIRARFNIGCINE